MIGWLLHFPLARNPAWFQGIPLLCGLQSYPHHFNWCWPEFQDQEFVFCPKLKKHDPRDPRTVYISTSKLIFVYKCRQIYQSHGSYGSPSCFLVAFCWGWGKTWRLVALQGTRRPPMPRCRRSLCIADLGEAAMNQRSSVHSLWNGRNVCLLHGGLKHLPLQKSQNLFLEKYL